MAKIKKRYPWAIGTKLSFEVQSRDFDSAWVNLQKTIDIYCYENEGDFSTVRLRTLQTLTNINRAAYNAGANPDQLFQLSMKLIAKISNIKSKKGLLQFAKNILNSSISMVPDKDYWASDKVNEALKYMRQHCADNLSRDEVAKVAGCSPAHFSRIFSATTGHSFKETVLDLKIKLAQDYLGQNDLSITVIAFKVGFGDANYFSSVFKRVAGLTPLQYRKKIMSPTRTRNK